MIGTGPDIHARTDTPDTLADLFSRNRLFRALFPYPAFGSAFAPPARCISRRVDISGFGRQPPLREMTSAAYGVSRDAIADGGAGDCPTQLFPQRHRHRKDCRREEAVYGTSRFGIMGVLEFVSRHWLFGHGISGVSASTTKPAPRGAGLVGSLDCSDATGWFG